MQRQVLTKGSSSRGRFLPVRRTQEGNARPHTSLGRHKAQLPLQPVPAESVCSLPCAPSCNNLDRARVWEIWTSYRYLQTGEGDLRGHAEHSPDPRNHSWYILGDIYPTHQGRSPPAMETAHSQVLYLTSSDSFHTGTFLLMSNLNLPCWNLSPLFLIWSITGIQNRSFLPCSSHLGIPAFITPVFLWLRSSNSFPPCKACFCSIPLLFSQLLHLPLKAQYQKLNSIFRGLIRSASWKAAMFVSLSMSVSFSTVWHY